MEHRFRLRFESGERRGEEVALPAGGLTVGRKPENDLVIADPSVSGRHAELVVDEGGVLLRDLGSTNGTRVGGEKTDQTRLAHGDRVRFGQVELRFIDGRLDDPPPAATTDGLERVDEALLARSGRGRYRLPIALGALVLAAGGTFWFLGLDSGAGGGHRRPVAPVPGNLLADSYSFESPEHGWDALEGASAWFERSPAARFSGAVGLRAALEEGGRAAIASPAVAVGAGRTLVLRARLAARDGAAVRAGVRLFGPEVAEGERRLATTAWGEWVEATSEPIEVSLEAPVVPGARAACAVLEAAGRGVADADDVSLVALARPAEPSRTRAEYRLYLLGDPPRAAVMSDVGRPVIADLSLVLGERERPDRARLRADDTERGWSLTFEGVTAGDTLRVLLAPGVAEQGLATVDAGGPRRQASDFDGEGIGEVLFGEGADLVGLSLKSPAAVRARPSGEGVLIEIRPAPTSVELRLDFGPERAAAGDLAAAARRAEQDNRLGEALAAWARLLAEYPYEGTLVREAEQARSRLVSAGLAELDAVREEVAEAGFFRLPDLYRRARERARAIGARYAGSEVEREARALEERIRGELVALESDRDADEIARLGAIAAGLEAAGAPTLAGAVREYLRETFHVEGP